MGPCAMLAFFFIENNIFFDARNFPISIATTEIQQSKSLQSSKKTLKSY